MMEIHRLMKHLINLDKKAVFNELNILASYLT